MQRPNEGSQECDPLPQKRLEQPDASTIVSKRVSLGGVEDLTAFKSEDDWFDFLLVNDPRFLKRIKQAEQSIDEGKGVRLEDVKW